MNNIEIRIPADLAGVLLREVRKPAAREPVVFALASHTRTTSRHLILVRELVIPPETAFLPSDGHGARWSGAYSIELLNRALEKQLGVFWFHAHGVDPRVVLSPDDIQSAEALLPKFQSVFPDRPHGSIVLGNMSADGLVALPGESALRRGVQVRLFSNGAFSTWPLSGTAQEQLLLQRQPLTNSGLVRQILGGTRVSVVGLSGGGSQVVPHLAAYGLGEVVGIDYQESDEGNRLASPNIGTFDARLKLRKTMSAHLRAKITNVSVRFRRVNAKAAEPAAYESLKDSDLIIGCVNNLHARADLTEISLRYCIPYIDIGLVLATAPNSELTPKPLSAIAGNAFTTLPGGPCLWCANFISEAKLAAETGGRGRSYLNDGTGNDAFVSSLNGTLASEAATEVLRVLLAFGGERATRRQFDGLHGTMLQMSIRKNPNCPRCSVVSGAGDPMWK